MPSTCESYLINELPNATEFNVILLALPESASNKLMSLSNSPGYTGLVKDQQLVLQLVNLGPLE